MDQTFNFRAEPVPLRRRVRPRAIVLALAALAVLSGLASFSRWVVESERRSIARAEAAEAAGSIVGTISGTDEPMVPSSIDDRLAIDATARADARAALEAARSAAAGRSTLLDAGPGQLTPLVSSLIFVDGPSGAPGVVSVAATRETWGAAVMGPSGTCYLLRFAPGEGVSYATGRSCTGDAALRARSASR